MRSSIYGAAIAAIVFSLPFAGTALAKNDGGHDVKSPSMYNGDHRPPEPAYQTNGQLNDIKVIVGDLDAHIAADIQNGRMRSTEARTMRAEGNALVRQATVDNRAGGGMIPSYQYHALLAQLNALRAQA